MKVFVSFVVLVVATGFVGQVRGAERIDFNRQVRPLLAQYCFKCHGADAHSREASLRLDERDAALGKGDSGELAIVPGKPDESEFIRRIMSEDEGERMPPIHTKTTLPESAKTIFREWIAQGAVYQKHWAYVPLDIPALQSMAFPPDEQGRPRHPIDAFIRDRLTQEGLKPSPPADRYTLVRRLYLDLIGLPPTPEEADAFVHDSSPDAYDKLVDGLLASKHYGERWARRWLDLARYADTNGFEKDRPRTIWPYRDWVVKALNDDMPYDQFSIRQLAGDMLPNATAEDLVATGFHRNTMLNEEGGIDPLEYRFYAMVDRVGVTGTTWLGLTMNCAQCHSHKYDPIDHFDFYRMMALLNNADEPTFYIPGESVEAKYREHLARIAKLEADLPSQYPGGEEALEKNFNAWLIRESEKASSWHVLTPTKIETNLPHLEVQHDGFILGSGDISKSDQYTLSFQAPLRGVRAIRLEVASHSSLPNDGPGLTNYEGPLGGFFLSEIQAFQAEKRLAFVRGEGTNDEEEDRVNDGAAVNAQAKAKAKTKANSPETPKKKEKNPAVAGAPAKSSKRNHAGAALDGEMSSGWQVLGGVGVSHAAVYHFEQPVDLHGGIDLKLLFEKHFACSLGHFRISVTTDDNPQATGHPASLESILSRSLKDMSLEERHTLRQRFLETTPEMAKAAAPLIAARKRPPRGEATLVMKERPPHHPRLTHRYHRGEYLQPMEEVTGGVPGFLPAFPADAHADRLTFAQWLFAPEHPLTARVAVNRQWQAFFGQGLVKSLEDFGYQSEAPSHPELLDWLAVDFMKQGWSMKRLHRLIVTSETYQQSAKVTPELLQRDPENRWLARGARFRLDAEVIRDTTLRAAGVLSAKMGGPGVYPPQPASVTTEGTYGKVDWKVSEGEDRYRRSLYTFIKRTAPFAMASTFDAPSGEACLARRDVSNSPLQALTLLNDQMFMEVADALAGKVMQQATTDRDRLLLAFRRCLTRLPAEDEWAMMNQFLQKQRGLQLDEKMVWTSVSRALLNLDEAITHP